MNLQSICLSSKSFVLCRKGMCGRSTTYLYAAIAVNVFLSSSLSNTQLKRLGT